MIFVIHVWISVWIQARKKYSAAICISLAQNQSALLVTRSFFQVNGILGGLVGITAGCAVVNVWESLFIGNMQE